MHSESSPMKPYYPMDFVEDMNGKRNSWEAVVLLPFINIEKLKEAVADVENNHSLMATLSASDRQRNSFGEVLWYDPLEDNSKVKSGSGNNSGVISSVEAISPGMSYVIRKTKPVITPGASFSQKMMNGTIIPYDSFPSLRSLPIKYIFIRLLHHKAMLGMKYKTLILGVSEQSLGTDEQALKQILGRHVYVNYPMRHEAKVVGVSTKEVDFFLNESRNKNNDTHTDINIDTDNTMEAATTVSITEKYRDEEEVEAWLQHAAKCQDHFISGRAGAIGSGSGGLAIGTVDTLLTVRPVLKSALRGSNGERAREYGNSTTQYPLQLVQMQEQSVRRQRADAAARRVTAKKLHPTAIATTSAAGKSPVTDKGSIRSFSTNRATLTATARIRICGTKISRTGVGTGLRQISFFLKHLR